MLIFFKVFAFAPALHNTLQNAFFSKISYVMIAIF